ncbi:MAG: hypothetical protein IJW55_00845 [Clostridia bacterium]|nr:hypothetical protein [Clostridia bacterium]
MKTSYATVRSEYAQNGSTYVTYGIALTEEENGFITILETIPNLCANQVKVQQLADLCNTLELSPIHLHEVIQDFLVTA